MQEIEQKNCFIIIFFKFLFFVVRVFLYPPQTKLGGGGGV